MTTITQLGDELLPVADGDPTPPHGIPRPVTAGATQSETSSAAARAHSRAMFDVCGDPCERHGSTLADCSSAGCASWARGDR